MRFMKLVTFSICMTLISQVCDVSLHTHRTVLPMTCVYRCVAAGEIQKDELEEVMQSLGYSLSHEQFSAMFNVLDVVSGQKDFCRFFSNLCHCFYTGW